MSQPGDMDRDDSTSPLAGGPDAPAVGQSRREFLIQTTAATAAVAVGCTTGCRTNMPEAPTYADPSAGSNGLIEIKLKINETDQRLKIEPQVTLLDVLRERLGLTGTKKGCDHGQCGACTVLVNGRRINSCLALAVMQDGGEITTIEGLAQGETLHPIQAAFIKHDGFQCGYCTCGQICSAVGMLRELKAGALSAVTLNVREAASPVKLTDDEIRERMSGNLCRCGAYNGIVAAIREASEKV